MRATKRNVGHAFPLSLAAALALTAAACQSTADLESDAPEAETSADELAGADETRAGEARGAQDSNLPVNALAASAGALLLQESTGGTPVEASAPVGSQDGFLDDEAQRLGLREQQTATLVGLYVERAREQLELTDIQMAELELLKALELAPQDPEVNALLNDVRALRGEGAGEVPVLLDDLSTFNEIKIQSLRAEAADRLAKGELMLERGQYDEAVTELQLALDHVRWAPISVDWDGVDERASELLEQALATREDARQDAIEEAQRETTSRLRAEEAATRELQAQQVDSLISKSISAFNSEAYATSRNFAEQALRLDPRNETAQDLADSAFEAGREKSDREFIRKKRIQFRVWQQELDSYRIPETDFVTLPDREDWLELTELRRNRVSIGRGTEEAPEDSALREELARTTLPGLVVREVESLGEVVAQVQAITGLPIVVDPAAEESVQSEGVLYEIPLNNAIGAVSALNIISDASGEDVTWTVKHGTVMFTTREKAGGEIVTRSHDISDLTISLPVFQAPRLDKLRLLEDIFDDDGGGPFGGLDEPTSGLEAQDLSDLVLKNVEPNTWEDEGVSIATYNDTTMIVTHRPEVQLEVSRFLDEIRRFNSMIVTIDTKFLTVADNFIQEIGVEWRGLDNSGAPFTDLDDITSGGEDNASLGLDNGGSGVDNGNSAGSPGAGFFYDDGGDGDFKGAISNIFGGSLGSALSTVGGLTTEIAVIDDLQLNAILRAIEKRNNISVVNSQQLSVYNSQTASVSVVNQRAYVQDFDVEVATNISIADPVINVLTEGVSLQVTPTVLYDRQNLRLEVQPTVASVVGLDTFSTSLANSLGTAVEFVLPELEVQSLKTTAFLPDGGTILIGGLSRIRNVERRAEVPFLANIPLLGFFFKTEGYNDEKESLMILMKAFITDIRELVEELER